MSGPTDERDYYHALGIPSGASLPEITSAYYLLARNYHPDTSAADSGSLEKFKLINEAYHVLSDREKRRDYDLRRRGHSGSSRQSAGGPAVRPTDAPIRSRAQPQELVLDLPISPEEARHGGWCEFILTLPQNCTRGCGSGRHDQRDCGVCGGTGTYRERHRVNVYIPRGATSGLLIPVRTPGEGAGKAQASKVLVRLEIRPSW